ncbi:MAG: hypothetical protein LBI74_02450 [Synergistaceae bacterium]|jgi:isocitrate dehydrogenase (NAD+)|nr:hypothetical protein [Synergistaceae bacterium]
MNAQIDKAAEEFRNLLETEFKRIGLMKETLTPINHENMDKIVVGIIPGDGIGPLIMSQTERVLHELAGSEISNGRMELRHIGGLDIENRAALKQSVPEDIMTEIKKCQIILKGPMTTPRPGDPWPNMISANSLLRRGLDLFCNMRPVSMPEKAIDWTFFRENIEGAYIWGNKGIQVNSDLAVDFVIETRQGSERIARAAFEYARKTGKRFVTAVTKANIVKLTDGNFLKVCRSVASEYPGINYDERLVDIVAAKLGDTEFNENLQVFILPNLYGDIISDIAAEMQGGVGSAGSANLGARYALFEAVHGTAPFLMQNNRGEYADPSSLLRALSLMLLHIGMRDKSKLLDRALDICGRTERKITITSKREDASTKEYTDYILRTIAELRRKD